MEDSHMDQPSSQPSASLSRLGGYQFTESGTGHGGIEERFRHLKAATLRAGLSMSGRRKRNSIETSVSSVEPMVDVSSSSGGHGGTGSEDIIREKGEGSLRASSCLVAMALGMDSEVKMVHQDGGNFYDCNLCMYIAREPVLTYCGHLFCWACFCKVPYIDSVVKECPVCLGEVTESNIIPIYGDGDSTRESKLETGLMIPPRPKAQRVESVRPQRVFRVSNVPVTEALRRIRTSISVVGDSQPGTSSDDRMSIDTNHATLIGGDVQQPRASRFTRVLSESAASLSSILAALNDAERLVEDLETHINHRQLQRSVAQVLPANHRGSLTASATVSPLVIHIPSDDEDSSSAPGPSLGQNVTNQGSRRRRHRSARGPRFNN